jgi:hypothetical protein
VPSAAAIQQFRIDLDRAMAPLPAIIRETAYALSRLSTVEAAHAVGCSRQMVGRRKHQIREAFLSAGIGPDYFAGGSTRQ